MPKILIRIAACLWLAAIPVAAQQTGSLEEKYPLLPEAREIELAKSAGLPFWTGEASIYVYRRGGYRKSQEGTNGFSCLVGRDYPKTLWPICFDPEGTETILPTLLREAELREQGKTEEEVRRDTAERFRTGQYRAPRRTGIAYMLSKENYVSIGGEPRWFPPHLMIYAPNITSKEIGASAQHMPHAPAVLYEGTPHAYIIVVVPDAMPTQPKH